MEVLLTLLIGLLVTASVYLMLARNVMRFLFGLGSLEQRGEPDDLCGRPSDAGSAGSLSPRGLLSPPDLVANALPQALVLTAIVIGFGLFAFALVLVYRGYDALGTLDTDEMRHAEPLETVSASAKSKAEGPSL